MEKLREGGVYTGTVEGYSSEGLGIVRLDGAVVFVPRAVRGEEIDLKITMVMKTAAAGEIVTSLLSFITAPTSALILIVMGYQLHVSRALLRPVLTTMGLRLGVLAVVCAAVSGILFAVIPFDKGLLLALMLQYTLPAPFIIPLFADLGDDAEYVSTTLSLGTVLAVVLFFFLAAFSLA